MEWDVAITGAGPAGSVCAAFCAGQGLKTLLLDRSHFPRDKVCGDCLNPSAWAIIHHLGWADHIRSLPSRTPRTVEFVSISGRAISTPLPSGTQPEIVVRRSELDQSLVKCAIAKGAVFKENHMVKKIEDGWKISTESDIFHARVLVAADGRNSSVCRQLGILKGASTDRVALQAHIPRPVSLQHCIRMTMHDEGYSGLTDLSDETANLCIVAKPENISRLKNHVTESLSLSENISWRSIAPLTRNKITSDLDRFFAIGDAFRIVEPFTGEGIYYGMRSGEIASHIIMAGLHSENWKQASERYRREIMAIYAGRLWINQLTRFFCLHPRLASKVIDSAPFRHRLIPALTQRVCGKAA